MEAKVHRRVQRYGWDKAVNDYDRYFVPLIKHCSERTIDMLDLKPGERMVDIATGTGVGAFMASERLGPSGELVATDISEKMIEATRAEAKQRGIENMDFARMDAEELEFEGGSFDVAMCVLGLMYPADPAEGDR